MTARIVLVALVLASTAGFVVGTSIERSSGGEAHAESGGESGEAADRGGESLESTPLVVAAAAFSLALAVAIWLRPAWRRLLLFAALAMVAFAVVDVRELFHQVDERDAGLALVAAVVAGLHLASAAVALLAPRDSLA
jgi:hypothetical protein